MGIEVLGGVQARGVAPVKLVGVIGSRKLTPLWAQKVGWVVDDLVGKGYRIGTGGAIGADQYVLEQLLRRDRCDQGTIYAAWSRYTGFPESIQELVRHFHQLGGALLWGPASHQESYAMVRRALLMRNCRLVEASVGLVAFVDASSKGSWFTIREALNTRKTVVVFPVGDEASVGKTTFNASLLPVIDYVKWGPLRCGGCWEGGFKAVFLK